MEAKNDIVYHYCSIDAFLNIIKTATLWLSDVCKSNDSEEYTWIRNKINSKMYDCLNATDSKASSIWSKYSIWILKIPTDNMLLVFLNLATI